ncbi:hypothetical protein Fleli_0081 [Bernardetia litoralis DSM 6794]|uniref:Teneurin-like YD-shell domain-containing protein n=1 Tax=Bernardetia litoralis (strain ATCC 23117 / DSM 6794 / NBRC 15988 / NCIMB 1366 / Fx l1 / Sio-4) TaxID=880071 RepID=I4AF54_BERLS|nr:RHS repeat protein [Bernardetia litoralis]AFM02589.1 hypothetical protein Fleli_0081 [Bernardetia litoralis DSM 6794]
MADFENTAYTKYEEEALANNPCDICFTCFPEDYNPLELFEGMDCESILSQIEQTVAEGLYATVEDHPEYCHYTACADFTTSKTFQLNMSRVFDWTEANTQYGLPTTTPTDELAALESFVSQDPLFIQYSSYKGQLVTALLKLSAFNGGNLSDAQNTTISIWEFIDHTVTPASHPALFDPNNENMPFQGVDLSDNNAIAERKWDLFRSRYLYEYEKIKENILNNEYSCTYLADQDIAIVKDPTLIPENDTEVTDFTNDFNAAIAPNCDMQVQIWMGQLQNTCDNITTAQWATIKTQLEGHCATMALNPQENPLRVLFANDPIVATIKTQIETACTNADLSALMPSSGCEIYGELPSDPTSAVARFDEGAIYLPLINNIPTVGNNDFELSFWFKAGATQLPKALFKLGNIQITQQTIDFVNGEATKQKLYFDIAGQQSATEINDSCTFIKLKVFHTTDAHGTKRWIRYEFSDNEQNWTAASTDQLNNPTTLIDFGDKIELGIRGNGIYEPTNALVWNIKLEKGNTYTSVYDFVFTDKTTLGHWLLKGSNTAAIQDQANPMNPNAVAYKIATPTYPNPAINWTNFCCQTDNAYTIQVSLQQEKTACEERFKEIGKRDAQIIIDRKRNELRAELIAQYNQDCLDTEETFKYTYTTAEHHYTLYYYDQAGNLVQTVSPEGVITDGNDNHNLETRYKYNSLNAPIDQETPDAGKSEFFYDKVARIRLSQNAQQETDDFYSYTKYDKQGRITEVGQLEGKQDATPLDIADLELEVDNIDFPSQTDYLLTQITRTFYDDQATGTPTQITPKNLRGRIAAVKVFENGQNLGAATFYDYDIHGNVEKLVQSLPDLDPKTVEYSYDLLSGNVHRVTYQKGEIDQFMHRYAYDADNRLEAVFTSSDGYIWDEDARYLYYAHGPMARVELGEYKVQGVDYYYTLQGWIKGVNLQGDHDAEATNNVQKYVSKDAFGYALHYYQNDYQSINGNFAWNASNTTDLFNGNIAAMSTTLKTAGEQTMLYRYDQLNRIKTSVSSQNMYQEGYSYDANGNILSLLRKDHNNATIDNLSYTYNTNQNNRLQSVNDNSGNNTGLENGVHSYAYDAIGNLTSDRDISQINWTVYGKIESVQKVDGTQIEYKYDGTGQRIYKKVATTTVTKETHYVRDGSGNVLAIYENKVINELVIYGSSRLGSYNAKTQKGKRTLGNKKYELSNHLGNVLAVISDNKIGIGSNGVADYYEPLVISESDYYPFGMAMKERSFSNEEYRFGFNTQEKSTELGEDTYTAEFWQYDSKIARRWNVDPVVKHYESSYAAFCGNPIYLIDIKGDNAGDYYKKDENGKLFKVGTDEIKDEKVYIQNDHGDKEFKGDSYYEVDGGQKVFNGDYNEGSLYTEDDFVRRIGDYLEGAKRKYHKTLSDNAIDDMSLEELENSYGDLSYVFAESWEGELDFKYDIADIPLAERKYKLPITNTLDLIGSKYYNVNGAGNFIWGKYTQLSNIPYRVVRLGPEVARFGNHIWNSWNPFTFESDPRHEVRAIRNGYYWDWRYNRRLYEKQHLIAN